MPNLPRAVWRTSTRTAAQGNCVELRQIDAVVQIRDTKNRSGPVLGFAAEEFSAFINGVKNGEFDT